MATEQTDTLEGWKEITDYLAALGHEVTERTARRYVRRRDSMPVYRRLGRVLAHKTAIGEWLSRQKVHAAVR
jgi:hypothetical protein